MVQHLAGVDHVKAVVRKGEPLPPLGHDPDGQARGPGNFLDSPVAHQLAGVRLQGGHLPAVCGQGIGGDAPPGTDIQGLAPRSGEKRAHGRPFPFGVVALDGLDKRVVEIARPDHGRLFRLLPQPVYGLLPGHGRRIGRGGTPVGVQDAQHPGGIARHHGIRGHVPGDHGACANHRAFADAHTFKDRRAHADPGLVTHAHRRALHIGPVLDAVTPVHDVVLSFSEVQRMGIMVRDDHFEGDQHVAADLDAVCAKD